MTVAKLSTKGVQVSLPVLWAHGLEGSPTGRKATWLREHGVPGLVSPDGRGKPLAGRLDGLEAALAAHPRWVCVGSSYGGLAMTALATRHPERIAHLVLLAPALVWNEPPVEDVEQLVIPASVPCDIVHGVNDRIIPVDVSRRLAARSPHVRLHEVDDGHVLEGSVDLLTALVLAARDA